MTALVMGKSQPAVSLPAADVRTQLVERVKYASDASHYYNMPEAVVVAKDAAEVAAVFKAAARDGKPVTLRSGGTSLAGQSSGDGHPHRYPPPLQGRGGPRPRRTRARPAGCDGPPSERPPAAVGVQAGPGPSVVGGRDHRRCHR